MNKYKGFCKLVLGFLILLLLYNGIVWTFFTKNLLTREEFVFTGDLARQGYLSGNIHPRKNFVDLPKQHLELFQYKGQPIDVVTMGDSFSQGRGNGPNRFYQDYLASKHQLEVLNIGYIFPHKNLIEQAVILLNSGYLEQIRPKILLLEIVERNSYKYSRAIDFQSAIPLDEVRKAVNSYQKKQQKIFGKTDLPNVSWLNNGNFKWLYYNLFYLFSPNAFFSSTYKLQLKENLFSGPKGDVLLVIDKALSKIENNDSKATVRFNDNLNKLSELLKEKGIRLYFMPAVDKYNLYQPCIIDNPFPKSTFFETLREQPKSYQFIDTKAILSKELSEGEKDIYWIDDTHWSWKASREIFEKISFD